MVVLVILAIVATVAIQSLQPQVDNQRFQSATSLLSAIGAATYGPQDKFQVDGTPLLSGFVADVGRLPRLNVDNDQTLPNPEATISELWDIDSTLAREFPYQFRNGPTQPVDYSKIRLPCGWRGPYLQLSAGANSLVDPWGRIPEFEISEQGQVSMVQIQVPPRSDDVPPQLLTQDLTTGKVQLTGKVAVADPQNSTIRVALLVPDPDSSLTTLISLDDEDEQPDSFLFSNVPIGLRAVVADVDGQRHIKYVQIPHRGLNIVFDCQNDN